MKNIFDFYRGKRVFLTGHTGYGGLKLFTDLEAMETGDVFYVMTLGETLAYEVDNIAVVLPHETELLQIDSSEDHVTLVTCTPYGKNTHRLLVRGKRVSEKDIPTEKLIEKGMDKLMENKTVFVIAHRLSTVRNSNAIMVLEKGEIIERGSHDDLLIQKRRYYELYTGKKELD